ncbi:phospholipase C, phosphocholine-specific [Gluconacetobacter sp. 1b LMG 1731]|uniref:phospholipase C n=1 Tax=Gluconacetobacter dulcium TaxID=2729096 RepID=A0A7W4NSG1_9PROT|nr:phospholipase C, phosphocholine-specific [Gluconacetobacter dulcium]MBB2164472.1 phospholipase C, phosphocholine-specific [Gluconacetobacter dulcium]MBB2193458.1 phospholipase C, phosphocholine-specific [Gluconacetobacter dulcium]
MSGPSRRRVLSTAGASLVGLPFMRSLVERALAIAPAHRTGSVQDVAHVVIHMQENRSFDHYFGAFNGVRGFSDPHPLRLPGGRPVWCQPSADHPDGYVLPYHGDSRSTRSFTVDGADQSHLANLTIFAGGRFDQWGATHEMRQRMLHFTAGDLPFYYDLANAFTLCDAWHASTMTQTYPNRLHLFSGCNGGGTVGGDPEMDNYGESETPSADMAQDQPLRADAYNWHTYAERLENAGIAWKVYQEYDNFGDNLLSVFPAFRPCPRESGLYARGRSWVSEHRSGADRTRSDGTQLVEAFRADIAAGRLPQVSWIVTAKDLSEHPEAIPARGEFVTAKLIEALVDHPETFARTVFITIYDEAGGFFDHMAPPVPPLTPDRGFSTVSTAGEAKQYPPGTPHPGAQPIGLGIRVPALIVSPWSRGGYICSQLFDHTSVLRFLERRFGVMEPNISPWRRAVCGDLLSAFDFSRPTADIPLTFPHIRDTQSRIARSLAGRAFAIPATQRQPRQMAGQRPVRPLPYDFTVDIVPDAEGAPSLLIANSGTVGICLSVHDNSDRNAPLFFTVGAGHDHHARLWAETGSDPRHDFTVRGPDGFIRHHCDTSPRLPVAVRAEAGSGQSLRLSLIGLTPLPQQIQLTDDTTPAHSTFHQTVLLAGAVHTVTVPLTHSDGWYALTIRSTTDPSFQARLYGAVRPTKTDPALETAMDDRSAPAAPRHT